MEKPVPYYDRFSDGPEQTVLTFAEHGIPGLRMIGRHKTSHAKAPLSAHWHPGCFEFTYLVQGNVSFSVDGKDYLLSGGDLFLTFPDEIHSTGNAPLSLHKMYWFQLEATDPEHFLFLQPETARWMIAQLRSLPSRVIKAGSSVTQLFKIIFQDLSPGSPEGRFQAAGLLNTFLCQILKSADSGRTAATPDIRRAADYICAHLQEPISMEELADVAMLSVSRFKQKFKDQMGTGPRNYINYQKIELAKHMLRQGAGATETAMNLGFSGSDYFSVVFRRYTFCSPMEYVKRKEESMPPVK